MIPIRGHLFQSSLRSHTLPSQAFKSATSKLLIRAAIKPSRGSDTSRRMEVKPCAALAFLVFKLISIPFSFQCFRLLAPATRALQGGEHSWRVLKHSFRPIGETRGDAVTYKWRGTMDAKSNEWMDLLYLIYTQEDPCIISYTVRTVERWRIETIL